MNIAPESQQQGRRALRTEVGAAVAHLLADTLRGEPPGFSPLQMPQDRQNLPIGRYLLGYGYVSPQQLVTALQQQRAAHNGSQPPFLGDILATQQIISPRVLSTFVVVQLVDRLIESPAFTPLRLGELLVAQGRLLPTQLAQAIQLQTWLRSKGVRVPIGEILTQLNMITAPEIDRALTGRSPQLP